MQLTLTNIVASGYQSRKIRLAICFASQELLSNVNLVETSVGNNNPYSTRCAVDRLLIPNNGAAILYL
jgi:hypothetical protein